MRLIPVLLACVLAVSTTAQSLRRAVVDAEVVAIARHVGVVPLGNDMFVHRIEPIEVLKGELAGRFSIVEHKRVADLPQPAIGETRLYCVVGNRSSDLPARFAPVYDLIGHPGSHLPFAEARTDDGNLRLVDIILTAERGAKPADTAAALLQLTLHGRPPARTEAAHMLRERSVLRSSLSEPALASLLARAVGETDDLEFKIALASLCAERRMPGVIEALCLSIDAVADERFARTLGRLARFVHDEDALDVLRPQIARAQSAAARNRLLLALGATETEAALEALLRLRRENGATPWVDAALRAHGSARALAAVDATDGGPVEGRDPRKR
jgi:hypothetical protein